MVMDAELLLAERFGLRDEVLGRPLDLVCVGHDVDRDGDCRSGELVIAPCLVVSPVVVGAVGEGPVVTSVVSGSNISSGAWGPNGASGAPSLQPPEKEKYYIINLLVTQTIPFVQAHKDKIIQLQIGRRRKDPSQKNTSPIVT